MVPDKKCKALTEQTKRYSPKQLRQMLTEGRIRLANKAEHETQVETAGAAAAAIGPPPLPAPALPARALPGMPPARDLPVIPGRRKPAVLIDLTAPDKSAETSDTLVDTPAAQVRALADQSLALAQTMRAQDRDLALALTMDPTAKPAPPRPPVGAKASGRARASISASKQTLDIRTGNTPLPPMAGVALATPNPPREMPRGTAPPSIDMGFASVIDRRAGAFQLPYEADEWGPPPVPAPPRRATRARRSETVSELRTIDGVPSTQRPVTTEAPASKGVPALITALIMGGLLAGATSLHLIAAQWWTPLAALAIAMALAVAGGELLIRMLAWMRAPRTIIAIAGVLGTLGGLFGGVFVGAWAAGGGSQWVFVGGAEIYSAVIDAVSSMTSLGGMWVLGWLSALAALLTMRSALAGLRITRR